MKKIVIALFLLITSLYAQKDLDKIIAIVGTEIITKGEVELQSLYFAYQKGINPNDPNLRKLVLNQIIEEKLIYNQAQLDSIIVTEDEVNKQVEFQLQNFIKQVGSKERLEQIYKMSYEKIKKELKVNARKNIMAQKVQEKRFGNREITRREVEDFFYDNKDSLPIVPTKYHIAHIFIMPKIDKESKRNVYNFASKLLDSLKNGSSFEELAKRYSQHKESAKDGGDLGYISRGGFLPEFESVAFALQVGKISKIVETPLGYHIIKLLDRKGEKIRVAQILLRFQSEENVDSVSVRFLRFIKDSIENGVNSFEYYANKYSEDKESNKFGGDLGKFDKSQVEPQLFAALQNLKVGEITNPLKLILSGDKYGYHIVKLTNIIPEHYPDLEKDYEEIKQAAEFNIRNKAYQNWIEELKTKIFLQINE